MRILHVADLTDRGGAYHYLFALIERQIQKHDVELIVGSREPGVAAPCPIRVTPGLDVLGRAPVTLGELHSDAVHVHNVANREALEQIGRFAGVSKRITVQDHRYFCPSRGKWTANGAPPPAWRGGDCPGHRLRGSKTSSGRGIQKIAPNRLVDPTRHVLARRHEGGLNQS